MQSGISLFFILFLCAPSEKPSLLILKKSILSVFLLNDLSNIRIDVLTPEYGLKTPEGNEITPIKDVSKSLFLNCLYEVPV